jgi:hypothetical protein
MGISMGGYLAWAAAFENRISACILYNGVYDGYDAFASDFPQSLRTAVENGNTNAVNTVIDILSDIDANLRFNMKHGMWTTGTNSPHRQRYRTKNKMSHFSSRGRKGRFIPRTTKMVYDALTCPKKYILFTSEEGAEEHCQSGAPAISNQRIFDWLDETL